MCAQNCYEIHVDKLIGDVFSSSTRQEAPTLVFNGPIILNQEFSIEMLIQRLSCQMGIPIEDFRKALKKGVDNDEEVNNFIKQAAKRFMKRLKWTTHPYIIC